MSKIHTNAAAVIFLAAIGVSTSSVSAEPLATRVGQIEGSIGPCIDYWGSNPVDGFDMLASANVVLSNRSAWLDQQDEQAKVDFLAGYDSSKAKAEKALADGKIDFFCKMTSVILSGVEIGQALK